MVKALILKGDKTTHGGTVLNGFSDYTIQGIPVAGVGHLVACPLCKGVFPIVQGYGGLTVNGVFVALDGHVTACGAKLIPSQHEEVVDDGGGGVIGAVAQAVLQQEPEQPEQTQYASLSDDQRSMINDGVYYSKSGQSETPFIQKAQFIPPEEEVRPEEAEQLDENGNRIDPLQETIWRTYYDDNMRQVYKEAPNNSFIGKTSSDPVTGEDVTNSEALLKRARRGELPGQENDTPADIFKPGGVYAGRKDNNNKIRTLTPEDYQNRKSRLLRNSVPVETPESYKQNDGQYYENLNDHTIFGIRNSPKSGETIEFINPSNPDIIRKNMKFHQND